MATLASEPGQALTVLASAARTATPPTDTIVVPPGTRGVLVVVDATAVTATPSVVVTIRGLDPASGKTVDLLVSAAIASVTTRVLRVHPELTASANLIAKDVVPNLIQIACVHADADSITYSVGIHFVG
jgi:hypothetical protein